MTAITKIEQSKMSFIDIYKAVHKCSNQEAENFYEVEAFQFRKAIEENKDFAACTDLSVAGVFLEVISNGLSFDKSSRHVYIMSRNVNVGTRETPKWEKRLTYSYAADGIIYLCKSARSIKNCSSPVIVYEGDELKVSNVNGYRSIDHSPAIPRKSNKIWGGYCFITNNDNSREAFWMDVAEVDRLKGFSAKQNKGNANELYTANEGQIDPGFFGTKIVKAALKHYSKKRTVNDNLYDDEVIEYTNEEDIITTESNQPLAF